MDEQIDMTRFDEWFESLTAEQKDVLAHLPPTWREDLKQFRDLKMEGYSDEQVDKFRSGYAISLLHLG